MRLPVHFSYPLYEVHLARAFTLQTQITEAKKVFESVSDRLFKRLPLTMDSSLYHPIRVCGPCPILPQSAVPWNILDPLEPHSVSSLLSFFVFQWINDLPSFLAYLLQSLRPERPLLACFPGERFFPVIAQALSVAEATHSQGLGNRFAPLLGLKEIAALASRIGFKEVVTDKISFEFFFQSFYDFVIFNRALGQTRALFPSLPPLSRAVLRALKHPFHDGFDVVFLTGWRE